MYLQIAALTVVLTFSGFVALIYNLSQGATAMVIVYVFAILLFLFGFVKMLRKWKESKDPLNSRIYKLITENPQEILWIFLKETTVRQNMVGIKVNEEKNYQMVIFDEDKKEYSIYLKGEHIKPLLNELKDAVPDAVFGYSEEKMYLFKNDLEEFRNMK
jgi:hypothetical protein